MTVYNFYIGAVNIRNAEKLVNSRFFEILGRIARLVCEIFIIVIKTTTS